jgi:hypothetical protein
VVGREETQPGDHEEIGGIMVCTAKEEGRHNGFDKSVMARGDPPSDDVLDIYDFFRTF